MRTWTQVRSELARSVKDRADEQTLEALRLELRAALLAEAIRKAVDALPPLTAEQRADLSRLLVPDAAPLRHVVAVAGGGKHDLSNRRADPATDGAA